VVTKCDLTAELQEAISDSARFPRRKVVKVQHYWFEVNAMTRPTELQEGDQTAYTRSNK
jgi:hypothetical protein